MTDDNSTRVNYSVNDKKIDQFVYYAKNFHEIVMLLYQMNDDNWAAVNERLAIFCHVSEKKEFKYMFPIDKASLHKLAVKCREFFIPNMYSQFLSRTVMTAPQVLQRGAWIKIGHNWNHRGAEEIAFWLHAQSKDMEWHTGDFQKLDKSIRD